MFIINNDEYRNLQEQVLDNKNKIRAHWEVDRVLADFGIKVIGRVDTEEDIEEQPVPEGGYQFGDAYAVGLEDTSYDYYIYTRPFAGEAEPHWFNIGQLSIVGPQGPEGERGPVGNPGTPNHLFAIDTVGPPTITSETAAEHPYYLSLNEGDWSIDINGEVYQYLPMSGGWTDMSVNLKGPRGAEGPRGLQGDRGEQGTQGSPGEPGPRGLGLVILGNDLASTDALPAPTSVRRDGAYLITVDGVKHLYAITGLGTSADPLKWEDLGVYTLTSSGGGSTIYRHRIYMSFGSYNNDSFYTYFDYYNSSPDPYTTSTIYNILPGDGHDASMGITAMGNTQYGTSIATSIGYYHEYDEYYTVGFEYMYVDNGSMYAQTSYGISITYVSDTVSQI